MHRQSFCRDLMLLASLGPLVACSSSSSTTPDLVHSAGSSSMGGAGGKAASGGTLANVGTNASGGSTLGAGATGGASSSGGSHSQGGSTSPTGSGVGGDGASGGTAVRASGGTSTRAGTGGRSTISSQSATGGISNPGGSKATGGTRSSTGGTGGTSTSATTAPQASLTALKIEANPKNVLSCFVSWKTDQAATSVVQFGTSEYEWEISDSKMVTDHRVLVIGMHASKAYKIKAISTAGGSSASAEGTFTTGTLPSAIPVAKVTVHDTSKTQPGWTLMNIQKGDGTATARSQHPAQAVMYDADGQPVWYYTQGTSVDRGGAVSVDLTDVGVLIGPSTDANVVNKEPPREVDFAGQTLWECATPTCGGTGTLTHHAAKLPNGNYVIQRDVSAGSGTAPVYEELTPDNKLVWSLDFSDFVAQPAGTSGDWCHGNSITIDIEKDEVYANCRFMGLIKTTYKNPTLKWHLPASYNGKGVNSMKFSPAASQYTDTHDPEIHDDGTILFFDNGGYSGVIGEEGNPNGYHSRAVEYKIDEASMTATLVWEFPGTFNVDPWYENDWYLPFWGDADRLANGNVLITAGVRGANAESRIFEVTKADGKVVWEFRLPADFGVYRSERITPPLVHAIQP